MGICMFPFFVTKFKIAIFCFIFLYLSWFYYTLVNVEAPEVTNNALESDFFRTGSGENAIQIVTT